MVKKRDQIIKKRIEGKFQKMLRRLSTLSLEADRQLLREAPHELYSMREFSDMMIAKLEQGKSARDAFQEVVNAGPK